MHFILQDPMSTRPGVVAAMTGKPNVDSVQLTDWLRHLRQFSVEPNDEVYQRVHRRLTAISRSIGQRWSGMSTSESTSLVHEFFLESTTAGQASVSDRRQFFALAATIMRQIFIGSAKRKMALKRAGTVVIAGNRGDIPVDVQSPERLVLVDQLIDLLHEDKPMAAGAFVQRHFARLKIDEIADTLDVAPSTVRRHLKFANAFIMRHMVDHG